MTVKDPDFISDKRKSELGFSRQKTKVVSMPWRRMLSVAGR